MTYQDEDQDVNEDFDTPDDRRRVGGRVLISRCLIDHDFVGFGRHGPYSISEAWIDLIQLASYKPRTIMVRKVTYHLNRGDVVASERFLAARWKWTRKKVRNFITELGAQRMVKKGPSKGPEIKVITIRNYSKFQGEPVETGPILRAHQAQKSVPKKEKNLNRKEDSKILSVTNVTSPPEDFSEAEISAETAQNEAKTPPTRKNRKSNVSPPEVARPDGTPTVLVDAIPADPSPNARGSFRSEIDAAFGVWAAIAKEFSLRPCKSISERMRSRMGQRLKTAGGVAAFESTLRAQIAGSPFLRGKVKPRSGQKPFVCDIDFVLQASGWDKIANGKYFDEKIATTEASSERQRQLSEDTQKFLDRIAEAEKAANIGKDPLDLIGGSRQQFTNARGGANNENR